MTETPACLQEAVEAIIAEDVCIVACTKLASVISLLVWIKSGTLATLQATPMYSPRFEKFGLCVGVGVEF